MEENKKNPNIELLDYYASSVLNGLLSSYIGAGDCIEAIERKSEKLAKLSYKLAKIMIDEKKNNN